MYVFSANDGNIVSELCIHFCKRTFYGLSLVKIFLFLINIDNNLKYILYKKLQSIYQKG